MTKIVDDFTTPFVVSDELRAWAKAEGLPDPDQQVGKFIDYHEMTDWRMKNGVKIKSRLAAFRYWLRMAKVYTQDPAPVRRYADRQPIGFIQPHLALPTERLDEAQLARGRELLTQTINKLANKMAVKK